MAEEPEQSRLERFMDKIADKIEKNHAQQPSLGAELRAVGREAIKDVRNSIHEVFFGRGEGSGEPGAPLNNTMQEITQDRGTLGNFENMLEQYAARGSVHGKDQDRGMDR